MIELPLMINPHGFVPHVAVTNHYESIKFDNGTWKRSVGGQWLGCVFLIIIINKYYPL